MSGRASLVGELILLLGLLALGYLIWQQQEQLVSVELELDKLRGAFSLPAADGSSAPAPRPQRKRKASS